MKWILGLICTAFFFTACDNTLVVTDKWKDIPIVWGFLSKSDTAHYIRVEKAFLDPNTSALTIARIPDSLYYDNAVVTLKRIASGQVYTLTRVNGDDEGYPRDPGTFAESPNYLYKIKANVIALGAGDKYEFSMQREDPLPPVTAETIILPAAKLRNPSPGANLLIKPGSTFTFSWDKVPDAGVYDLQMRFHYSEKSPATGNIYEPFSIKWTVAQGIQDPEGSGNPGYKMDGTDFYNSIAANIEVDPNATRIFQSIDIIVWCGGKELLQYNITLGANSGITSTQDAPQYTNLSEGRGIFTSRNVSDNTGFGLHNQSLEELKNGSITGDLNFQ
jgi:hypothetical protein